MMRNVISHACLAGLSWLIVVFPLITAINAAELREEREIASAQAANEAMQQEVACLGKIIEHEAWNEKVFFRYYVGLIYKARRDDKSREWPSSFCAMPQQPNQISGLLDAMAGPQDPKNLEIAADLVYDDWQRFKMPPGWECARYYAMSKTVLVRVAAKDPDALQKLGITAKRTGYRYFETKLQSIEPFGHHVAYKEKKACKYPMPTI